MSVSQSRTQERTGVELSTDDELTVADTGGGCLVFAVETEHRDHLDREVEVAKRLVGFADVSDWSAIRDALRARGLGVGATTNLPVFDIDELPSREEETAAEGEPAVLGDLGKVPAAWLDDDDTNGRPEPSRSEPADFGGGETTGVQDL
jgi:hypothetical protein